PWLSTHTWCHRPAARSYQLKLCPVPPFEPTQCSCNTQPSSSNVISLVPAACPDTVTSQRPSQKSNWRCSAAVQPAGGAAPCASTVRGARTAIPANTTQRGTRGMSELHGRGWGGWVVTDLRGDAGAGFRPDTASATGPREPD